MNAIDSLDWLESESIFVFRELVAESRNPVLLFSGGKDSTLLVHLACKAFWPAPLPFPVMHIDTGHNFPEVIEFRDRLAEELDLRLIVRSVEDSIAAGRVSVALPTASRNAAQSVTLRDAIAEFGFDAAIGGARRDEERARAKERIFSVRDAKGRWNPKLQRPELWDSYSGALGPGEHLRVFPISDWTELDVWSYIAREKVGLPSLYYAHQRDVVQRGASLIAMTELTPAAPGETIEQRSVRFRTVGDITCTAPVASEAENVEAVLAETLLSRISERGATRLDDAATDAAMELRKREGYF
ncbi:MAG: sulfate adenylyltransferase subunit CysD [Burkholderiaceae bacterium]